VLAAAFLVEFLSGGAVPALSALTPAPRRTPATVPGTVADRYARPALRPAAPLVLVHGVTAEGKDDPRAVRAADLLARAGFRVLVPTVPGLTTGRLRPDDVEPVVAAIQAAGPRTAVLGVSVGSGPAVLAAADARVRDRVATVVGLGGYASAETLVRFFLTGDHAFGPHRGHVEHDPAVVEAFLAANADLLAGADPRRLASDRAAARRFLADLPAAARALLERLSPLAAVGTLRARLVLVHARGDRAVPFTEALRLAAARPTGTRVVLVGSLEHVEGVDGGGLLRSAQDLLALWSVMYALRSAR
jgi:pimeloyl-ACP methyl ester carboxylesterase